jgi:DNA-binding transcriptional regulator YhcF (GntR family)
MGETFNPNSPIYIQIMDEIKKRIVSGAMKPGERIAPVRELAASFGVNPNTMQRALSELEREGLVFTERTSGRFLTDDEKLIQSLRQQLAKQKLKEFIWQMTSLGFTIPQLCEMIVRYAKSEGSAQGV